MQKFIVFEGIDCCGKTTQIRHLARSLQDNGLSVLSTREPGGTPLAEKIRDLILDENLNALTELMLLSAARHEHVQKLIAPALQKGDVVLCDRFYGSTLAYQCYGKGLDRQVAMQVTNMVIGPNKPGLTIMLDIMPAVAQARKSSRAGQANNHYDDRGIQFYERLRSGFLEIAQNEAGWHVVSADRDEDIVAEHIHRIVGQWLDFSHIAT